ncbi:MAG: aldehyde dehydrogenase family protein [Bifidobacterium pseudocatenulatum]
MGDAARTAQSQLAQANTEAKNQLLNAIADALDQHADDIAAANAHRHEPMPKPTAWTPANSTDSNSTSSASPPPRKAYATWHPYQTPSAKSYADTIWKTAYDCEQVRVPIGVLGMIYEARPNVTVDVASLCIKSGNAVLLRGGHAAEHTNAATLAVIADVLTKHGYDHNMIATVDQYGRDGATAMMEARGHIDVLIPRGGAGLIQAVVRNSKVPVIETGAGNVHIYVDRTGNPDKAIPILINAKTQRVGVCNATEKLLVHKDIAESFLPKAAAALAAAGVEMHADERAYEHHRTCRNRKCATRACHRRGLGHRISGTQNRHQGGRLA